VSRARHCPSRQRLCLGGKLLGERIGHGRVDHDPLGRHADLALVHEGTEGRRLHRLVNIGIVEDDERGLAAELQQTALQVFRCDLRHDPADPG
jgi:hypothetical protein